jgi:hypothetical protein
MTPMHWHMYPIQIMQNMGYFAPWSRQNSWVDRVAIDNIRKANTPQVWYNSGLDVC